jgi:hypothetical protein
MLKSAARFLESRSTDCIHRRERVKELKESKRCVHEEKGVLKQVEAENTSTGMMLDLLFVVMVVGGALEGR